MLCLCHHLSRRETPQKVNQDHGSEPLIVPQIAAVRALMRVIWITIRLMQMQVHFFIVYSSSCLNSLEGEDADDEYEFPDDYTMTPEMLEELHEFEMRATASASESGMPGGYCNASISSFFLRIFNLQNPRRTTQFPRFKPVNIAELAGINKCCKDAGSESHEPDHDNTNFSATAGGCTIFTKS